MLERSRHWESGWASTTGCEMDRRRMGSDFAPTSRCRGTSTSAWTVAWTPSTNSESNQASTTLISSSRYILSRGSRRPSRVWMRVDSSGLWTMTNAGGRPMSTARLSSGCSNECPEVIFNVGYSALCFGCACDIGSRGLQLTPSVWAHPAVRLVPPTWSLVLDWPSCCMRMRRLLAN